MNVRQDVSTSCMLSSCCATYMLRDHLSAVPYVITPVGLVSIPHGDQN